MQVKDFAEKMNVSQSNASVFVYMHPKFRCADGTGIDYDKVMSYIDGFLDMVKEIQDIVYELNSKGLSDRQIAIKLYGDYKTMSKYNLIHYHIWTAENFLGIIPRNFFYKNIKDLHKRITKLWEEVKDEKKRVC